MPLFDTFALLDQKMLLAINGLAGIGLVDELMFLISSKMVWIPFYGLVLCTLITQFGVKSGGWIALGSLALVILTDQASVLLFKEFFCRPRPCHVDGLKELLNLRNGHCGGAYGFISSHAANVSGLATLWYLSFRRVSRFWSLLLLWPLTVCLSRVYLGVHYPSDVLVGALLGVAAGLLMYKLIHLSIR